MNVKLSDRILWFNGMSEVSASDIPQLCVKYNMLPSNFIVSDLTNDVKKHNDTYPADKIKTEVGSISFNTDFMLDDNFDLFEIVTEKFFKDFVEGLSAMDINQRYERLEQEYDLICQYNLERYIKHTYLITQSMLANNVVWSGRGSSCASYTLYVLGIHNIDSVKYNIPITEFFK